MTSKFHLAHGIFSPAFLFLAGIVLLVNGCNANPETPSDADILGKWYAEFHEEELGGDCSVEYSFQKNEELVLTLECAGKQLAIPMLWRTEGGILYAIEKDALEFYEEESTDWTGVSYKINGSTLEFYEGGKLTASFKKVN